MLQWRRDPERIPIDFARRCPSYTQAQRDRDRAYSMRLRPFVLSARRSRSSKEEVVDGSSGLLCLSLLSEWNPIIVSGCLNVCYGHERTFAQTSDGCALPLNANVQFAPTKCPMMTGLGQTYWRFIPF